MVSGRRSSSRQPLSLSLSHTQMRTHTDTLCVSPGYFNKSFCLF